MLVLQRVHLEGLRAVDVDVYCADVCDLVLPEEVVSGSLEEPLVCVDHRVALPSPPAPLDQRHSPAQLLQGQLVSQHHCADCVWPRLPHREGRNVLVEIPEDAQVDAVQALLEGLGVAGLGAPAIAGDERTGPDLGGEQADVEQSRYYFVVAVEVRGRSLALEGAGLGGRVVNFGQPLPGPVDLAGFGVFVPGLALYCPLLFGHRHLAALAYALHVSTLLLLQRATLSLPGPFGLDAPLDLRLRGGDDARRDYFFLCFFGLGGSPGLVGAFGDVLLIFATVSGLGIAVGDSLGCGALRLVIFLGVLLLFFGEEGEEVWGEGVGVVGSVVHASGPVIVGLLFFEMRNITNL